MSSILKALRKLEEEKARSQGGTPDIARNILRTGPRRQRNPWVFPGSVAALLLALGLTGYILGERSEFTAPPPGSPAAAIAPAIAVAPARPAPPAGKKLAAEPPQAAVSVSFSPPSAPTTPAVAPKKISSPPSAALQQVLPKTLPKAAKPRPEMAAKEGAVPLPSLVLTGIAYQDEREGRMAIVNDLPVMEGTMIEGAKVVEISRDRVRFDYSGRSFEMRLEEPTPK